MIVNNSYLITDELLSTIEAGSTIFDVEAGKMYLMSEPGELVEVDDITADTLEELTELIAAGGKVKIAKATDIPTGFAITKDTKVVNNAELTVKEDTEGNGVFMVTEGTLTLEGNGTINGLGKNDYSIAVWTKGNGKTIINDGYFTNVGAFSEEDGAHFDLIYASENGQVEINGGEFKCETPKWTLNIKDKDRATASIVVKGGKFHGFDPSNCEVEGPNTNFVAPGYKVVEEDGVYTVIAE
jgi:hypothetical protein